MNTSLQLSLLIVMAMLCVLVTGKYMINRHQVPDLALGEYTSPRVEAKKKLPKDRSKILNIIS